ncbi:MAG: glycosyltransferase family 39 protein [Lachnospiraceae bacterium]|nr:glycosyltransferase family 39 protein [Lachnospiraceae bacterium]
MMSKFKEESIGYKILTAAVFAAALFFVYRIFTAGLMALPYPKELLEPSNVALTNLFIEGKSPYAPSSLDWSTPAVNYDYPFLGSLLAAGIAKLTGCNAVTAHFVISFSCILLSGFIGYVFVRPYTRTTVAPLLAALLFMFCHWRFGYISAAPDDPALLFFLLTMLVATSSQVRYKPLWCAIGSTACFYTKQYMVLVFAGIFIYMFLYSKKDAFKLLAWMLVINAAVAGIITYSWPMYWMKAFVFTYLGSMFGGGFRLTTFLEQFKYILISFAGLFVILLIAAILAIRHALQKRDEKKGPRFKENDIFTLCVVNTIIMIAPLFVLGRNDGAFISYFLQLWMPSVSVVTLVCFERMKPDGGSFIYGLIYAGIAAFTVYFGFGKLPLHVLTPQEIEKWQKAYEYTATNSDKGYVFYSRVLSYDGFARQNGDWFCGHDGEIGTHTLDYIGYSGLDPAWFPYTKKLVDQNLAYRESVVEKIRNHEYALITFEEDGSSYIITDELCEENGYRRIDTLDLQTGNMPYEVAFYVPR